MEDLEDKATWVLILFPGVLSMGILAQMVGLGDLNEIEVFFICIFFTVIDVALALALSRLILWIFSRDSNERRSKSKGKGFFAICIFVVAVLVGIASGLAAEGDTFFVVLRSLPLTNTLNKRSSAAPLTFLLTQNTRGELKKEGDARPTPDKVTEAFVRIQLKDEAIYEGWPEFYSISAEHMQIYLSPACRVAKNGESYLAEKIAGPGIVLFSDEIQYVQFVDRQASPCFGKWFGHDAAQASPSQQQAPTSK